jgi:hypothetical protein
VFQYDSDYDRMRQRERFAQIRAEYQRVQAPSVAPVRRRRESRMRRIVARRVPLFRV